MAGNPGARLRIDMHVHTRASFDCLSDPIAVVERAVERGLDMLCITDHNTIDAAVTLHARYPDRIIIGEEVKTAERVDVIGLFLNEPIPAGTPAVECCDRIHDQGGIVYLPHPFARGKGGSGRILLRIGDQVDIIEGFNARLHDAKLNERAVQWAANAEKPVGAGSDAHTLGEVGRASTWLRSFDGPASFLESIRHARIDGRASSRFVHLASTWAKLRKRFTEAPA